MSSIVIEYGVLLNEKVESLLQLDVLFRDLGDDQV
jgi:hypothetical protein